MTNDAMREALAHLRDGEELQSLEEAARSRSEADWIVGMNATRAATIRLRSSLRRRRLARPRADADAGDPRPPRGGDPRLRARAVLARRRALRGRRRARATRAASTPAPSRGWAPPQEAEAIVAAVARPARATITKLEKTKRTERAPLLYDLTSLQREANTRFGFSARRTLGAAQRCYEEHKALTYPRTSSRYLTERHDPRDQADRRAASARNPSTRTAAAYVAGLDMLPLGRVVNDEKVGDHHAIIPTNAEHTLEKMSDDDRRIYDLVARRFLAVFHPDAVFENTRVETTVAEHVFRTRGKVLLVPGWRGVYGELAEGEARDEDDEGRDQQLPKLEQGEAVGRRDVEVAGEGDQAAAALLRRLAARRDGDRRQARRRRGAARGDEGLGHRHAGDARGDHRAPDRRRLRRARRAARSCRPRRA